MWFLLFLFLFTTALVLLDYYVYRNWHRFARGRRRLRHTLPLYKILMITMPLVLPVAMVITDWWVTEQPLLRGFVLGFWIFWYAPKILIGAVLGLKDLARFSVWLFNWFKERLRPNDTPRAPEMPDLSDMSRMSRSEFLQKMGWTAAAVPFVVIGFGMFRTLYNFQVRRVNLFIPGLPAQLEGLTIAQISDLHAGSFFSPQPMRYVRELIEGQRPDAIVITGDFVNSSTEEFPTIGGELAALSAPLGVYACLGNHDHYAHAASVGRLIRETGVNLLVNGHHTVRVDGSSLHVIGTDNTGFRQNFANLAAATEDLQRNEHGEEVRILLAHDPSFWDLQVRPEYPEIDVMLAGHTHGGQVGFEMGPARWGLSRVAYERWAGLYRESSPAPRGLQQLYVNRGIGTVGPPVRIGIRPEITVHTLRRAT